jgi:predicted nuclease of predicted toxin-antitoxin system
MNIYLDDNFSDQILAGKLRKAGHSLVRPIEVGLSGASDAKHLEYATRHELVLMTKDRDDFLDLHKLLESASGRYAGILLVAYDNDAAKDKKTIHVVETVAKLVQSEAPIGQQFIFLNQWR